MTDFLGWDIGGAHVKAVWLNADGQAVRIWHRVAPLWRGLHRLTDSVAAIRQEAGAAAFRHVATMTGELTDIFPTRAEGVRQIDRCLERVLDDEDLYYFSAESEFVRTARRRAAEVGSMNWYASAQLVARFVDRGMFVDIGSTTTDLVRLQDGRAVMDGFTDAERLASRELLYTGVVRTALMSLASRIETRRGRCNLVAEQFAATADVYNLLGRLPPSLLPFETRDGEGCSAFESARRIARMVGRDCEAGEDLEEWVALAEAFAQAQRDRIAENLQAHVDAEDPGVFVGAGTGRFMLPQVAVRCGMEYCSVDSLLRDRCVAPDPFTLADCLPAYAVAELYRLKHAGS